MTVESEIETRPPVNEIDNERLAKRAEIRRRIVACQLADKRVAELNEALHEADRKIDNAADQHREATAPIQAELHAIEGKELDRLVAKLDTDGTMEARRRELQQELRQANVALETQVANLNREKALLNAEIQKLTLGRKDGVFTLESSLIELAPDELRRDLWVAIRAAEWANKRVNAASAYIAELETSARQFEQANHRASAGWVHQRSSPRPHGSEREVARRLDNWRAELAAAQAAHQAALAHQAECRQRCLAE